LSVALFNEALLALFPDTTTDIKRFFQFGTRRELDSSIHSTCRFVYTAQSARLIEYQMMACSNPVEQLAFINGRELSLNQTNTAIQTILGSNSVSFMNNSASYVDLNAPELANSSSNAFFYSNESQGFDIDEARLQSQLGVQGQQELAGGGTTGNRDAGAQRVFFGGGTTGNRDAGALAPGNFTFVPPNADGDAPVPLANNLVTSGLRSGSNAIGQDAIDGLIARQSAAVQSDGNFNFGNSYDFASFAGGGSGSGGRYGSAQTPAANVDSTAVWVAPVVTDASGKTTVKVTLPETSGKWRIISRGCTKETLAGQSEAEVITRKNFFVDVRLTESLQEGDEISLLATIHNLTDYEGDASATLKIEGAESPFTTDLSFKVQPGATEVVFRPYKVPFVPVLKVTVETKAGGRNDALVSDVLVRPWGLEYADESGGVTSGIAGVQLTLPEGQTYSGRRLLIGLSPSIEQALIDLALQRTATLAPFGGGFGCNLPAQQETLGSSLLAAVSALHYGRDRNASDYELAVLTERVKMLAASLTIGQAEAGSWAWNSLKESSDIVSTATAYWALALTRDAGIEVDHAVFERTEKFFADTLPKLAANDCEGKAVLVHALAVTGKADFSMANRLYRERASLSEPALAYLAASFVRMGRDSFARDLLTLLERKALRDERGTRQLVSWNGGGTHTLLRDRAEISAIVLWCYARLQRDSKVAASAANYLLTHTAPRGRNSSSALGTIVAALTEYYAKGGRSGDDFEVVVTINGKSAGKIASAQLRRTRFFFIPADQINAGDNAIRLEVKGRGEIRYLATLSGFAGDMKDPESFDQPRFMSRAYYHDNQSYRDVPLGVLSTSPVASLELGQRFRAHVSVYSRNAHDRYLTWEEQLPAGALLVEGSVKGNFDRLERNGSLLILSYKPGRVADLDYELVAHAPGNFRVLPSVLREAADRGLMRVGRAAKLTILKPGIKSDDPYEMNRSEHFELATKLFNDGKFAEAKRHLDVLFSKPEYRKYYERDIARMLLWILTERKPLDAQRIVDMFEILRERHPDLVIPFDKILRVGEAYRVIGEYERAWLVFRATIDSSFLNDANVSAVLEDQGQFLGSIDYQQKLWRDYPDSPDAVAAYVALGQALFNKAPSAETLPRKTGEEKLKPEDLYLRSKGYLQNFLTYYPTDPLADDAAYALTNTYFSLKDYPGVVDTAETFALRYSDSKLQTSFQYMAALGHFWQHHYDKALESAAIVAGGESSDRDYVRYITAQIYHARGEPSKALEWYQRVKSVYPDAADSINYFEQKGISIPEVTTLKPGESVELKIAHRNIREAALQVYKVDLMKLYLREKNLTSITKVNLAGIEPETVRTIALGDGKDYRERERTVDLAIKDEGAYLVICRGDDLFTSGLVLVTPLKLEIQEDAPAGSIRVNVLNHTNDSYVAEAEVKAIGSGMSDFRSGTTGPRGVFLGTDIAGAATVIAKHGDARYAFYRGVQTLGSPPEAAANGQQQAEPQQEQAPRRRVQLDYLDNVKGQNKLFIGEGLKNWDEQRRKGGKGVEVKKAR
jgi:tetratricopeptide (TPR) repeat protein